MEFLRRNTDRTAKITLPGPFTMSRQAKNEFYPSQEALAMDFAAAVNAEIKDLFAAGADVIQIDEPWLRNDPDAARRIAVKAINRALEGVTVPTVVHLCFGYAAVVHDKPEGYSFLAELENSYAQQVYEAHDPDVFIYYRNPNTVPELLDAHGFPLSFAYKANRRKIFDYVYEGSWWVNLDSIEGEAAKLLRRDPTQAERFFGNRLVQGAGAWLPEGLWDGRYAGLVAEPA